MKTALSDPYSLPSHHVTNCTPEKSTRPMALGVPVVATLPKSALETIGWIPFNAPLAMDLMKMRGRKSPARNRGRRRRFCLQMLAGLGLGVSAAAVGQETQLAYYVPDPADQGQEIQLVSTDRHPSSSFRDFLQASGPLPEEAEPMPEPVIIQDFAPPPAEINPFFVMAQKSSSDLPPPVQEPVGDEAPPATEPAERADPFIDDVPVADEQATQAEPVIPAPIEAPLADQVAEAFLSPVVIQRRPSLGATAGSYSTAPNMIGDHFGGTFLYGLIGNHTVPLAGGDRRFKIAENVSPVPQDRVFFNYNHFENSLRDSNDQNQSLDRFTFGFEKTFWRGHASLEARLPFASALNSTQTFGDLDTQSTELGNLAAALKVKLFSSCKCTISGGTAITIPTGDDFDLFNANTLELRVKNDSVHLAPFLGYLNQISCDTFFQGFVQADFDLGGNDVYTSGGFQGVIQDQHLLFIDASLGHWICRNCDPCARLNGVAAIAELHYTTTMNDTDSVASVTNPFNRLDILNASGALNFQLGRTSLRVGAAAPLTDNEEKLFDAEVIFQLNRNF